MMTRIAMRRCVPIGVPPCYRAPLILPNGAAACRAISKRVTRALISVSDKTGLVEFARALARARRRAGLHRRHRARRSREAGLAVTDVTELTGFPEMMDGRVKTLHPKVHGGLLGVRDDPEHQAAMLAHGIEPIDLLVVNLYPFEATVAAGGRYDDCVENIDIGGPAMIRAAAKNHAYVAVVIDPADYAAVLAELDGARGRRHARRCADAWPQKAFARTAAYDAAISSWFAERARRDDAAVSARFGGALAEVLRYGENPHQAAAFYRDGEHAARASRRRGSCRARSSPTTTSTTPTRPSSCVAEFDPARSAAVAIVKHANPCGVAEGATLREAYEKALRCDPVSAFGGIVALNRTLDAEAAEAIVEIFTEVVIAPDATRGGDRHRRGKKNLRLLLAGGLPDPRAARA